MRYKCISAFIYLILTAAIGIVFLVYPSSNASGENSNKLISSRDSRKAAETTATPTDIVYSSFPEPLFCDQVNAINPGPKWEVVTIGRSTLDDLRNYLNTFDNYRSQLRFDNSIFFLPTSIYSTSPIIEVCSINNIILVLKIRDRVTSQGGAYSKVQDAVIDFGVPDAITWYYGRPALRVAFWFSRGIALSVNTGLEDQPSFGYVQEIVFFPYMSPIDYQTKWPFNRTFSKDFPIPNSDDPASLFPQSQNPFNFNNMVATVTMEPSRTPTQVFQPRSTKTPTITPVSIVRNNP